MMTAKEMILTVFSAAAANNIVFTRFLGISFCGTENKRYLGPAVTVVMLITAAICSALSELLSNHGLSEYNTIVFSIIILAVCSFLQLICGKIFGLSFPIIALNSAVLGLAVLSASEGMSILESVLTALGAGLGFSLALIIMSSLQLKLENPDIPKAFKGLPITLLAAAVISMAVFAF